MTTTISQACAPTTGRPPQWWASVAAWGTLAASLPSAIWRLLMITGLLPGTAEMRHLHEGEVGYVLGLSIAQVFCAVLVVGLVRPWGERFVGVAINRWVPVVLGALGGTAMTYLFTVATTVGLLAGQRPDQGTVHDGPLALMLLAYAPMFFFGPMALIATVGYALRRRVTPGTAGRSAAGLRFPSPSA